MPTDMLWAQASAGGAAGGLLTFMPLVVFVGIFYMLIWRPQQKTNKERQRMLAAVKRGDKVLTAGGLYATVQGVRADILDVRIGDNAKAELNRNFVTKVIAAAVEERVTAAMTADKK
ncbi:MAG: preprotein translocase subunit YajC [Elusimicrobiota bacterium]